MKKIFHFDTVNLPSFSAVLKRGIRAYAIDKEMAEPITTLWLLGIDGTCLRIQSKMHDLDDWNEIGTLVFQVVEENEVPHFVDIPSSWMQVVLVEALLFDSDECFAECGVIVHVVSGEELIVLPGADIYTLAIKSPFFSTMFSPENNISKYVRKIL